MPVVAGLVEIWARRRSVGFVFVVGAVEAVGEDASGAGLQEGWLATHGPGEDVAVESAAND